MTTANPVPTLPFNLSNIYIVSHKAAKDATAADFRSGKAAIGTGPYRFVSYQSGVPLGTRKGLFMLEGADWSGLYLQRTFLQRTRRWPSLDCPINHDFQQFGFRPEESRAKQIQVLGAANAGRLKA